MHGGFQNGLVMRPIYSGGDTVSGYIHVLNTCLTNPTEFDPLFAVSPWAGGGGGAVSLCDIKTATPSASPSSIHLDPFHSHLPHTYTYNPSSALLRTQLTLSDTAVHRLRLTDSDSPPFFFHPHSSSSCLWESHSLATPSQPPRFFSKHDGPTHDTTFRARRALQGRLCARRQHGSRVLPSTNA